MEEENIYFKSGFLIVKRFETLYEIYSTKYQLTSEVYSMPRIDMLPNDSKIKYRGIDRDALNDYEDSSTFAEIRLSELAKEGKCNDGIIFSFNDALDVYNWLDNIKNEYEIIWVRLAGSNEMVPPGFISIGFEPSYFIGDHFSASCDCMIFPRWHGTDEEGSLFIKHHSKLNKYGVFNNTDDVKEFIEYYLSFDWTEHDDYFLCEVFINNIK